jgi:hypothetical protein
VLATDDERERRRLLAAYRDRVEARTTRLQRVLHTLTHLVDPYERHDDATAPTPSTPSTPSTPATQQEATTMSTDVTTIHELDPATQRALAASLFNRVWELLEKGDRTTADDDEMVNAAHASRLHWTSIGTPRHLAVGDWQISRVYSVLGRAEPAVHHARRCHDLAVTVTDEPWLLASAYEGLARAYAVAGDRAAAVEWKAKAVAQLELVTDADDREIVEGDVATLPV